MAEFWWGASPASEIRKHKQYYPACKGKCEPILNHMLQGLDVDENPMLINPAKNKTLPVIYEDEDIIIINIVAITYLGLLTLDKSTKTAPIFLIQKSF